jgi:hypothetical protein
MYTAINGIYENGQLTFSEKPPTIKKSKVLILFLDEQKASSSNKKGVKLGSLVGKYSIPNDFNEPIDDLSEYI